MSIIFAEKLYWWIRLFMFTIMELIEKLLLNQKSYIFIESQYVQMWKMKTLHIKLCMSYCMFEFLTFSGITLFLYFFSLWIYQILEDLELLFWFPTELCLIHNKSTNKLPTHSFFDAQTLTNAPRGKECHGNSWLTFML